MCVAAVGGQDAEIGCGWAFQTNNRVQPGPYWSGGVVVKDNSYRVHEVMRSWGGSGGMPGMEDQVGAGFCTAKPPPSASGPVFVGCGCHLRKSFIEPIG